MYGKNFRGMEQQQATYKLFVGQIPKHLTEEDIRLVFGIFGEIVQVYLMVESGTNQSKGAAFVIYQNKADADMAIQKMNNKMLEGAAFPLQVRYAEQKKSQTEPKVFVGMIPPGTTEDDLRKLFSSYGELTDVHVMRSPSGEGKELYCTHDR